MISIRRGRNCLDYRVPAFFGLDNHEAQAWRIGILLMVWCGEIARWRHLDRSNDLIKLQSVVA